VSQQSTTSDHSVGVAAIWLRAGARRMLMDGMSDVTRILEQIDTGDPRAAE
jgi:hypothetical protein